VAASPLADCIGPIPRRKRRMGPLFFAWRRRWCPAHLILFLALLTGCGENFNKDIETVRAAHTITDDSNDELARQIAGARGKVEWIGSRFEK